MNAISFSDLRNSMKMYMDLVFDNHEPIIVTRKNNENIVLLSIHDYNSIIETNYLLSSEQNKDHIISSLKKSRSGLMSKKDINIK